MKFKAGDELYVNDKWYFDVMSVNGDKVALQMYYKTGYPGEDGLRTAVKEVPAEIINFDSEYSSGRYKAHIKSTELKQYVGGLIGNLVQSPDVYAMLNDTNVMVSEKVSHVMHIRTIDKQRLSIKAKALLERLEKVDPDKYKTSQWKEFSEIIGVPYTHLLEHVFNEYNFRIMDELKAESKTFITNFDDFVSINKMLEDTGAYTATPAPASPGIAAEAGSDMAVPLLKKKKKIFTKKPSEVIEGMDGFADLKHNQQLNKDIQDHNFAGIIIPDMTHIKMLLGMKSDDMPGVNTNFPLAADNKADGDANVKSARPAAFSPDLNRNIRNLISHKISQFKESLTESAGNEDAVYKEKLYSFLDYPWTNETDKKIAGALNSKRDTFSTAGVHEIEVYLKEFWASNEAQVKKLSDDFISDFMVLTDISVNEGDKKFT